jgi:hypothetical protein
MPLLQRFQVLLHPKQLNALRKIERRTGISVGALIRLAVDAWLDKQGDVKRTGHKQAVSRKRS